MTSQRTYCESSGTCANRQCPHWIDFGMGLDLPIESKENTDECPGYERHPFLRQIESIFQEGK